jgi:prepilin-type N-terminal cleavage/methylation domain-containing protein
MIIRTGAGFSLVEIMVALLVLSMGLLSLTSAAASVTRLSGRATVLTRGAALGASRVESILAEGCAAGSGDSTVGRFQLRWTVTPRGRAADVLVTLASPQPGGWKTDTVSTRVPCRP